MNVLGSGNAATKVPGVSTRASDRPSSPGVPEPESSYRDNPGQPIICRLSELRHHASYVRLRFTVPVSKLSALAEQGEQAFREPLAITRERIVIDGYARWELARLKGRLALPCIEYELTEEQAIRWLLQKHCRSNGMNDFFRILLARDLEPCLKAKSLSNQRFGGRMKGSSNLSEDATVDVRKEIAAAAGVSVGNVSKVKQLLAIGHPELLEALRGSEVSIHRAWRWIKESPNQQIEVLRTYRTERGVNKSIRDLISRHKQKPTRTAPDLGSLARRLSELEPYECNSVRVSVIRASGKMIFVTEELIQSLRPYQESMPKCTTDNP